MNPTIITLLLGRILGEMYRLQDACLPHGSGKEPGHVFGLLNGIEEALDAEFERTKSISNEQLDALRDVLEEAQNSPDFTGYYSIEGELKRAGIERETARTMLKFLKASGSFTDVIHKMDSSNSPVECKNFELDEWDK